MVTGASSGLGAELARQLANQHHANLVLVARRPDRLAALKAQLQKDAGVEVVTLTADLSDVRECNRVFSEAIAGRDIAAVILNAGLTHFGRMLEQTPENVLQIVNTNVAGCAVLTHLFARHLVAEKKDAGLMLVSSLGGSAPLPFQAVYGATKAFETSLGCALAAELQGTGVSVTVFAPGGMATEMSDATGLGSKFPKGHPMNLEAAVCARVALRALRSRSLVSVPGRLNRVLAVLTKLGPRKLVLSVTRGTFLKELPPGP